MPIQTLVLRLLLAVVLGGIIGWERETVDKPAGLRTLTLVCVGSTLFVLLSLDLIHAQGELAWDPLRIVAAIIQGIGFLGAGTVLQRGETVRGLTTAAALWAVTAVGVAVGFGMYTTAVLGAFTILLVLRGLHYITPHSDSK
ncbi:MAG: MgtC/SapB family protein [Chloroflexi bacterium]|nr:MgtC/SapB family protein [Chloroflexota bacterium]